AAAVAKLGEDVAAAVAKIGRMAAMSLDPTFGILTNSIYSSAESFDFGQKPLEALKNALQSGLRGAYDASPGAIEAQLGAPCDWQNDLAKYAQKAWHLYRVEQGAEGAVDKFQQGDIVGGIEDALGAASNAYNFMQSCFAAGTRLLTPDGD